MMTLLLNGLIHISSETRQRVVAARDFFVTSLVTSLEPDEMVTEIEVDALPIGTGWAFEEFARRHGDYALAAVAVTMARRDGVASDTRIALMGVGEMPMRMPELEAMIDGRELSDALINEAVEALRTQITPNSDLNGSADYRRHLAGALTRRALSDAWSRADARGA